MSQMMPYEGWPMVPAEPSLEPVPSAPDILLLVRSLQEHDLAVTELLGEVLATLVLPGNVEKLSESLHGASLCQMAERWWERYKALGDKREGRS